RRCLRCLSVGVKESLPVEEVGNGLAAPGIANPIFREASQVLETEFHLGGGIGRKVVLRRLNELANLEETGQLLSGVSVGKDAQEDVGSDGLSSGQGVHIGRCVWFHDVPCGSLAASEARMDNSSPIRSHARS